MISQEVEQSDCWAAFGICFLVGFVLHVAGKDLFKSKWTRLKPSVCYIIKTIYIISANNNSDDDKHNASNPSFPFRREIKSNLQLPGSTGIDQSSLWIQKNWGEVEEGAPKRAILARIGQAWIVMAMRKLEVTAQMTWNKMTPILQQY